LTSQCLSAETLAAFAAGVLDATTRAPVVAHLETCGDCTAAVLSANEYLREEQSARRAPVRWQWWLPIAAALLIAIVAVPLLRRHDDALSQLVRLAPGSARIVEPRLYGGFAWAPYRGPVRASDPSASAARLKLGGAAGETIERAQSDPSNDAQHAAAIALVLVDQPTDAIDRLRKITAQSPDDARPWSDLAAARYAAAMQLERPSLLPEALAAADAALRIDASSAEALFNRALILERMGLAAVARKAWLRYLEVDSGSSWATEARAHLRELPVATRSSEFEHDRPLLENAAAARDPTRLRTLVDRYRQQARTYAEGEYLGNWAEAVRNNDSSAAERWLTIAREIGGEIRRLSGESLLFESVAVIDAATPVARAAIAEGHVLYRQGRIAFSRQSSGPAERDLRLAASRFEEAGTPMVFLARYYAASARFAQNDVAGARLELERSAVDADARPRFIALGAAVRWELARTHVMADDWAGALPILTAGAALYRRLGEHAGEAFLESMSAGTLVRLGRQDDSWNARIRAFRALSAEGDASLLARSVLSSTDSELRAGRQESALALSAIAREVAGTTAPPVLVVDTLVRKSLLEAAMGRTVDARNTAAEGEVVAGRIPDQAMRARTLADIAVATGAAMTDIDPRRASDALSKAIDFYRARGLREALPEPLLFRARCALRLHDAAAARRDLEDGIAMVEQRRGAPNEGLPSTGVVVAERSLFAEAIRLALDEGNPSFAFAYAERSRGGAITVDEMQRRLSGSDAALLEIVALPRELVTIAVTSGDVAVGRNPLNEEQVAVLASASSGEDAMPALMALYDAIVRPVDATLAGASRVIVVADPRLEGVPFAALFDRGARRFLVERVAVAMASSATSLMHDDAPHRLASVVAIGLPSGAAAAVRGLPESEREVQDIAQLYAHAIRIAPAEATWVAFTRAASRNIDMLHIAGHTERQPGAGDAALLFAGAPGESVNRITWKSISAASRIDAKVVVLSACETLRRPVSANTRALTLAEAFIATGAREVVGTLVPIADRDARELFRAFHQGIVAGDDTVDALRNAQLAALRGEPRNALPAWAGLAVLSTRIPRRKR
jgi:CHAT domain-containing protein